LSFALSRSKLTQSIYLISIPQISTNLQKIIAQTQNKNRIHRKYALSALGNKKHVLLNDPVSISLQDFNAQLEHAKRNGKFVQSSTAFINQYRVRHFMEAVVLGGSGNDTTTVQSAFTRPFGRVAHMNAHLRVRSADLERVGVTPPPAPLRENEGCIRRLGRYCVLYSILLFTKLGSHPVSVQVHEATVQEVDHARNKGPEKTRREPTSARCTVNYSDVSSTLGTLWDQAENARIIFIL